MITPEEASALAKESFHEHYGDRQIRFKEIREDDQYFFLVVAKKYRLIGQRSFLVEKETGKVISFNPHPYGEYGRLISSMRKVQLSSIQKLKLRFAK